MTYMDISMLRQNIMLARLTEHKGTNSVIEYNGYTFDFETIPDDDMFLQYVLRCREDKCTYSHLFVDDLAKIIQKNYGHI